MYFEFESIPMAMESTISTPQMFPMSGLSRRHRRLSSSTQSLRELIDSENCIENITPSHCDLYLITRKKLSQMTTNTVKQSQDLRREVLLTSIHRTITSKSTASPTINGFSVNELTASTPIIDSSVTTTQIRDRLDANDSQPMIINSDQHFKCKSGFISLFVFIFVSILRLILSKKYLSFDLLPEIIQSFVI